MVIYYSWSGNTKAYAEILAEVIDSSIVEIKETKQRKGKLDFVKAVKQSIMKNDAELLAIPVVSAESEIYVCGPVWAGSVCVPIKTFLKKSDLNGKTVNALATYAGGNINNCEQDIKKIIEDNGGTLGHYMPFACPGNKPVDLQLIRQQIKEIV